MNAPTPPALIRPDNDVLRIALVAGRDKPAITGHRDLTWRALSDMLARPIERAAKDGPGWLPSAIETHREKKNAQPWCALVLDIEAKTVTDKTDGVKTAIGPEPPPLAEALTEAELLGWRGIGHTSHSHRDPAILPAGIAHHRYRLIFAVSRPVEVPEVQPLCAHVAARLGLGDCVDTSAMEAARFFWLPACPPERRALFEHGSCDGDPLDVNALLADAQREADAIGRAVEANRKRQTSKRGNVIGAFNGAHDIGALLERHGYRRRGRGRWMWPESSSGMPGVVLLRESDPPRVFSHHGGDPLADGHAHDAFSVFCTLEHGGDMRSAVREAARLLGMDRAPGSADPPDPAPEPEPAPEPAPSTDTAQCDPARGLAELAARGAGVARPDWDRDRVLGALAYLDPMHDLGMALRAVHHASGGGLDGLDLMAAWLGAESSEDADRLDSAWMALDPRPAKPITLRSLYKEARTQGWDGQPYRAPPPPLASVDLATMRHTRPPQRYALDKLLPRALVTLLGAHGGAGKSALALTLAAHVCCGREWAGHGAVMGRALYVSLEDTGAMVLDRLCQIIAAYGLDADAVTGGLTVLDGTRGDSALAVERPFGRDLAPTRLLREVAEAATDCTLVVIDNASDAFAGDENNRVHVRGFMRMLGDIARQSGAAVLLLAHVDKAAAKYGALGNSYSGSTAWHNSARSRLALTEREGVIELAQEKLTVAKKADPVALSWTDRGVLVPGGTGGADAMRAILDADDDKALLACFEAAAEAGASIPTGETGPATTWHALSIYPECPERLRTSKPRLRAAVARLVRAGKIVRETYTTPSRHTRERYVLAESAAARVRAGSDRSTTGANPRPLCADSAHRGVGIGAAQESVQSNRRKNPPTETRRFPWEVMT